MAARHGSTAAVLSDDDVWQTAFDLAARQDGDLKPWWILPGPASIDRLVPMLPLSREVGKLKQLVEATSLYRMTLGQPRQSQLLDVLAELLAEEQEAIGQAVMIDLSPPN